MSKIAIKGNESGTATFTIEAPATNTDRTFELPDEAGKVLTDASDIEPQVKTATNASGSAPIFAARAWVNFDGQTVPPTIRASGNVSSVTRGGTGDFTMNFTTAMPDVNYTANCTSNSGNSNFLYVFNVAGMTTTSMRLFSNRGQGSPAVDHPLNCVAIFR